MSNKKNNTLDETIETLKSKRAEYLETVDLVAQKFIDEQENLVEQIMIDVENRVKRVSKDELRKGYVSIQDTDLSISYKIWHTDFVGDSPYLINEHVVEAIWNKINVLVSEANKSQDVYLHFNTFDRSIGKVYFY